MHQDFEDPEAEIDRMIELGLHGVKLHPDTQEVDMDDPRLMDVYEIMQARELPLVVHTGDFRHDFSHPRRLKNILRTFPDLVVNGAHLAGCFIPDIGYDVLHAERLFVDASSTLPFVGARRFGELVRMWGVDRVMFGSDFPMWNPNCEYAVLASCGFTDDEMEKLTWRNAERFAVNSRFTVITDTDALSVVNTRWNLNGLLNFLCNITSSTTVRTFFFNDLTASLAVRTSLHILHHTKQGLLRIYHLTFTTTL